MAGVNFRWRTQAKLFILSRSCTMYLRCALAVLFWGPKLPKATHPRELRICPICLSFALHAAVLHIHCCCTDAQNADKSVEKFLSRLVLTIMPLYLGLFRIFLFLRLPWSKQKLRCKVHDDCVQCGVGSWHWPTAGPLRHNAVTCHNFRHERHLNFYCKDHKLQHFWRRHLWLR